MTTETDLSAIKDDAEQHRRGGDRRDASDRRRQVHGLFNARFFSPDDGRGRRRTERRGDSSWLGWLRRRPSS